MTTRTGPRPAPTPLKLLKGEKKNRINFDEPVVPAGVVELPARLSDTAVGVWAALAPVAERMGVLSVADVPAFARACEVVAATDRLADVVAQSPPIIKAAGRDDRGLVRNPAWSMFLRSVEAERRWLSEFGLTPASRSLLRRPVQTDERERLLS